MFALEAPVPCKSKPEVRFISQSVNAPREVSQTFQSQQLTGESLSKSEQNVVTFERPREPQKIERVLHQVPGKGCQYFLSENWAPTLLNKSSVLLSHYNITGQWMILQLNRGSNKAQGWSFMHVDSASTNDRNSLMSGFATRMRSPIRA